MAESILLQFYMGSVPDCCGRRLADIQKWNDMQLEQVHDYIQWLFPLTEASAYNSEAPILTTDDIAAFRASPELRKAQIKSFERLLAFYGFRIVDEGDGKKIKIDPTAEFGIQSRNWLRPGDHNLLRITRILRSLELLGSETHARAWLACLEGVLQTTEGSKIGPRTLAFWRAAVPPHSASTLAGSCRDTIFTG